MPEEAKQALENLSKNANSLTPEQLQRLGDIAYGMSLVKEAQPKKEAYKSQPAAVISANTATGSLSIFL